MPETSAAPAAPTATTPPKASEPVIHVIPDEFYGAAGHVRLPPRPAPSVPPNVAAGAPPSTAKAKGSAIWLLIPLAALILLGGAGFGVWYFVLRKPASAVPSVSKPAVTLPPADTTTPPAPEPAPAPTPEPATSTPVVPPPPEPTPAPGTAKAGAPDADNDGLSDVEEILYGTDKNKTDADNDGFSDSVEVINLYNPAGFKPTRLVDAGLATPFTSSIGKYEILYPTSWAKADQGDGGVVFTNAQNQPVSVSMRDNLDEKSILDVYLSDNPEVSPSQVQPFYTKAGLEGVRGPDGQVAYVTGGGKIYVIAYAPGLQENAYFRDTFLMMVNSFKIAQ